MPVQTISESISCPHCNERENIYKHGQRDGLPRYQCMRCRSVFRPASLSKSPEKSRRIASAIAGYLKGMSYAKAGRHLASGLDDVPVSEASTFRWVHRYPKAIAKLVTDKPETGDEWVADELFVDVAGKRYYLFNVMDSKTRYLLATHLSPVRTGAAAGAVMRKAREAAGRLPKTIKTDRLRSYEGAIENVFGADVKHVQSDGIRAAVNNNLAERMQGTFRERDKVLRGLKSREAGQAYLDAWGLNYNYFRPHMRLDNRTPAEAANLALPFRNWQEAVDMVRAANPVRRTTLNASRPRHRLRPRMG